MAATAAQKAALKRAREARAAKRDDLVVPAVRVPSGKRPGKFKARMAVFVVALVAVGGAVLAALGPSTKADEDEDEDEDVGPGLQPDPPGEPEPELDEPIEPDEPVEPDEPPNLDPPDPGPDCGFGYLEARASILNALAVDQGRVGTQAVNNTIAEEADLERFGPNGVVPLGATNAAEACAMQEAIQLKYAKWAEDGIWPGAVVADEEGGDGGDDGEGGGGGNEPSDDDEGGDDDEQSGESSPCSDVDVTPVANQTVNLLLPYIVSATNPPIAQSEGFVFPFNDWAALRNYYADAAILEALTSLGADTEFFHTNAEQDAEPCYFAEPSQLALRDKIRELWDQYHPGGVI